MTDKNLIIHVRFAPDGTVFEIGERPSALTAQQWFTKLSEKAGNAFESLSGGRGVFRLSRDEIESMKATVLQ
ncbi:hypothetical protein LG047_13805 [Methylocystis sp. WRRC1]|uniref:hypothetical protein n=1 Tax=Methylocystis sp. WRRC1 TaxID=1732014 RepID=UPI001D155964|nr:hypothetical protein [Methylocystis sp. WRRC1]MCC3246382.1 hypothetical protein [Methylocystis sp. WRRC1]